MKISKQRLRYLIKEELESVLGPHEMAAEGPTMVSMDDPASLVGAIGDLVDDAEHEVSEEVGMAVNQLQAIAATAIELSDLIKDMEYVPEWGDGKIAVVLDKLTTIRSYMIGKQIGQ